MKASIAGRRADFYGVAFTDMATSGISVGTSSPTLLTAGLTQRVEIAVQNTDSGNPIFVGGSAVNAGSGIRIAAGEILSFSITEDIDIYGIATGGAVDTRVMELR